MGTKRLTTSDNQSLITSEKTSTLIGEKAQVLLEKRLSKTRGAFTDGNQAAHRIETIVNDLVNYRLNDFDEACRFVQSIK